MAPTPTAPASTQAVILSSIDTATPHPTATASPVPRPFLISLTTYPDGGDDLYLCYHGFNQPSFILYEDGELVVLREGYQKANLSQIEIAELMQRIADTGLFERPEGVYEGGWDELMVNGVRYHPDYSQSSTDPAQRAAEILDDYEPTKLEPYIPPSLLLAIYGVFDFEFVKEIFPGETRVVEEWEGAPLADYGVGWHKLSGVDVNTVLEQFDSFPDFRLFRHGDKKYVAQTCADFEWP